MLMKTKTTETNTTYPTATVEVLILLWLEYHPLVVSYARGDIGLQFAAACRLPIPKHAPFAIGYAFEGKPHEYLPNVVGRLSDGTPFIAEAGMEDDKRSGHNLAKAEAARHLSPVVPLLNKGNV